jgi:hypothetical protein
METKTRSSRARAAGTVGILVLAVCLGVPPVWAGSSPDDESFHFLKGTRWKYVGTSNGRPTSVVQEVFKISQGDLFIKGESVTLHHLMMRSVIGGPEGESESISTTGYLGTDGEYFFTGTLGAAPVRMYKLGAKKGDVWPCTDPRLKATSDRQFLHLGEESVSVPAGMFRHARHLQVRVSQSGITSTGDFYVVPGVGIVKTEAQSEGGGGKRHVLLELESFTPPGEF